MKEEILEELEKYSQLEGSELGEVCESLLHLQRYDYCFSKEFVKAVEKEIRVRVKDFKENFKLTETNETVIQTHTSFERK